MAFLKCKTGFIAARLSRAFFYGVIYPTCSPRAFCQRAKKEIMANEFTIDGERFTTATVPDSGLVEIYHHTKRRLVAAFNPDTASLFSHRAYGSWSSIHPDTSLSLLEKIQPHVVEQCKRRIIKRYS